MPDLVRKPGSNVATCSGQEKPDPNINPSGAKGLGEVGIIGAAAAIANAIYNASGKRLRDLPITPDKVLMG